MAGAFPTHLYVATNKFKEQYHNVGEIIEMCIKFEFIALLSEVLNFDYSWVSIPDNAIIENGYRTGKIGLLQLGMGDLSVDLTMITEELTAAVDFSYPYYISKMTFLAQKPQPLPKNLTIFYPFSKSLWIIYAAFTFGCSLVFIKMYFGKREYIRTFFLTVGNVFGQPISLNIISVKHKFLFGSWILGNSILVYSYRATLLSFLLVTPKKGISTISELSDAVVEGSVKCVTYQDTDLADVLLNSSDSSIRIIGKSLQENTQSFVPGKGYTLDGTEKSAFIGVDVLNRAEKFQYFLSEDSFFPVYFSILLRKNFCCKKVVDKAIRKIVEAGLYNRILQDVYMLFTIQKNAHSLKEVEEHQLNFEDIQGAVFILVCGHILSLLVLMLEYLFPKLFKYSQ